ncbi:MAG: hypothetical protein WCP20_14690 [Desulfuromonadales bacterium]
MENVLPMTIRPFYYQSLVASFLLAPDKAPNLLQDWLATRIDLGELFDDNFTLNQLQYWKWVAIPVALAGDNKYGIPTVRNLLIGLSPSKVNCKILPKWTDTFLDDAARASITKVADLVRKHFHCNQLFYCPILDRSNTSCTINGPSVGLSAYLGAFSLVTGMQPPDILPTGDVTVDASLIEVGCLADKLRVAKEKQFSAFMYPALTSSDPLDTNDSCGIKKIPVRTLRDAEIIWSRYSTGCAHEIAHFDRLLDDPSHLLEALPDQSTVLLPIIEDEYRRIVELLAPLFSIGEKTALEALGIFTQKMESILNRPDWDYKKCQICLSFFEPLLLEAILLYRAELAFRLSLLQMKLANHSGDIESLQQLEMFTSQAYKQIRTHNADDKKLEFMVNLFVGKMHNSYSFSPVIPDEFQKEFDDIIPWLEQVFAKSKERLG